MLTYRGVSYHVDEEAKIVYFFNDSRIELCKTCPLEKGKGSVETKEGTLVSVLGCPCDMLRQVASGVVSMDAYLAIKEADMFDQFIDNIKANDMPIGGVDIESLVKTQ